MQKLIYVVVGLLLCISCSNDSNHSEENSIWYSNTYILDHGEKMFTDYEPDSVLYSDSARGYNIDAPLNYALLDTTQFRLFNALPYDFKDVAVYCKIDTVEQEFMIAHFDLVPGQYCQVGKIAGIESPTTFTTIQGTELYMDAMKKMDPEHVTFRIICPDPLFEKISRIKQSTHVKFSRYGSGNWGVLSPRDARYYTTMFANMGYLYSSKTFEDAFKNYEGILHNNNGDPIDRDAVYLSMINKPKLNLGVVTGSGIGGLGGGSAFGVRSEYIQKYCTLGNNWPLEVYAHEFSHTIGFGHSSNMTYGNSKGSLVNIVKQVYLEMHNKGDLPFIGDPFAVDTDPFLEKEPIQEETDAYQLKNMKI
ncbi:hypothetical protein K4L44_09550 [Halosquirtibacter laminarini]|uniref:Uncharacterized protein n=1 Tax=Halosquirtibacter laminarini TaxID=3374600 RepID=A0AC61NBI3_9BACT|nr:hypothetical protein K4L44_09550 [Prolixibacteraceae bacterium]